MIKLKRFIKPFELKLKRKSTEDVKAVKFQIDIENTGQEKIFVELSRHTDFSEYKHITVSGKPYDYGSLFDELARKPRKLLGLMVIHHTCVEQTNEIVYFTNQYPFQRGEHLSVLLVESKNPYQMQDKTAFVDLKKRSIEFIISEFITMDLNVYPGVTTIVLTLED